MNSGGQPFRRQGSYSSKIRTAGHFGINAGNVVRNSWMGDNVSRSASPSPSQSPRLSPRQPRKANVSANYSLCICMLRGSMHYCDISPRVLSHHIVDFLGSRRMETAPTSIVVLLRPTLVQSDEPSDLRGSLSPTTRHRCTHVLLYIALGTGSPRRSPIQLLTVTGVA